MTDYEWTPIQDLPDDWQAIQCDALHALSSVWNDQRARLEGSNTYVQFLQELKREIAIETGVLEKLYSIDRGITRLLIEQGIDEALIPHDATNRPTPEVVALIRDQEQAVDSIFNVVGQQRQLSTSYIKQLHQLLTRHQQSSQAIDQFGHLMDVDMLRGDWKKQPNNPIRPDGTLHAYCPPEQVASQMDQLIAWYHEHRSRGIPPEIEAAWLHHRFTQIHPFQDGNGRVARNLASLVFVQAGWFPLSIRNDDREAYIDALEQADAGDLNPLVKLFCKAQQKAFVRALSLSERVISKTENLTNVLDAIATNLRLRQEGKQQANRETAEQFANGLFDITESRLERFEDELKNALQAIEDSYVALARARNGEAKDYYYRFQIVETARKSDYYANISAYRSWLRLAVGVKSLQTELLLSFHVLGYEHIGLMACSASGYHRSDDEEGGRSIVQDLQPLSEAPFQFTYADDEAKLKERFARWLEDILLVWTRYWRGGLSL